MDDFDEIRTLEEWVKNQAYGGIPQEDDPPLELGNVDEEEFHISPLVEHDIEGGSPLTITVKEDLPPVDWDFQKWVSDLFSQLKMF